MILRSEHDESSLRRSSLGTATRDGVGTERRIHLAVDPIGGVPRDTSFAHVAHNPDNGPPNLEPARLEMLANRILSGPEMLGRCTCDQRDPLRTGRHVVFVKAPAL